MLPSKGPTIPAASSSSIILPALLYPIFILLCIFDVDPVFNNTEEWYLRIPEDRRPDKNQPFYHLLAENEDKTTYVAYVSQQNLENDDSNEPFNDPTVKLLFDGNDKDGNYIIKQSTN